MTKLGSSGGDGITTLPSVIGRQRHYQAHKAPRKQRKAARGHHERGDKNDCIGQKMEALDKAERGFGDAGLDVDDSSRWKVAGGERCLGKATGKNER